MATTSGDELTDDDLYRLGLELQMQLENEEKMSAQEQFKDYEREYLLKREDATQKLSFASFLVRRPEHDFRRRGVNLLMELVNDSTADSRSVLFYLAVAHYRLRCLSEAERYVNILLEKEPANRQALAFQHLCQRCKARRILVLVNGSKSSDLAFYRMLEHIQPEDHVILFTSVASKDAEGENDDSEYMASDSLRAARVSYLGEEVQRKYRDICEQRGLSYSYVVEEGEPLRDVCDMIKQENIDTCYVGGGSEQKMGFFDRITSTSVSEYLFKNAKCDVMVAKIAKRYPAK